MKKLINCILGVSLCFAFASCSDQSPKTPHEPEKTSANTAEAPQSTPSPKEPDWLDIHEYRRVEKLITSSILKDYFGLDGYAVGYAAVEGQCHRLVDKLTRRYALYQLALLTGSDDPYVRCVAMICLSKDVEKYKDIILRAGTDQTVKYTPLGCMLDEITVKEFAESLVNEKFFRDCYISIPTELSKEPNFGNIGI